ncbi:hypothetical protein HYS84_03025 [Candidatus Saccharibacteria bacterium]|nr:hypothetical protein [Candidatus Saccharibacteria bacterium]
MFGLGNDQNQNAAAQVPVTPVDAVTPAGVTASAPSAPTIPDPMVTPAPTPATVPETNGTDSVNMENAYIDPGPQIGVAKASMPDTAPTAASMAAPSPPQVANDDSLAQVRQQAINSLQPLVGHLDQVPEDKFKTLMMLIQTSDNSKLLNDAYEAANKIPDEKTRAQALLDVVNEINYFNHQQKTGS